MFRFPKLSCSLAELFFFEGKRRVDPVRNDIDRKQAERKEGSVFCEVLLYLVLPRFGWEGVGEGTAISYVLSVAFVPVSRPHRFLSWCSANVVLLSLRAFRGMPAEQHGGSCLV